MHPAVVTFLRDIFLTFLGIGIFGIGSIYAAKSTSQIRWLGVLGACAGFLLFLFGFSAVVALLDRHATM
jgi:hypothetical protein